MPDAAGRPLRTGDDLTGHHDPAADPGTEGDQCEGILSAADPEPRLGVGEGAHVVGRDAGQPGGLGDHGGQRHIAPSQEAGHHHSPSPDDGRPQGDSDGVGPSPAALGQLRHHRGDKGRHGAGIGVGQRPRVTDEDLAQRIGQDGVEAVICELDACNGGTARDDGQQAGGSPRPGHLHRRLLLDESRLDEGAHRTCRRRRGQPQALGEVAATHGAGGDQGEQRPGAEAASTAHRRLPLPSSSAATGAARPVTWDDVHRRPRRTDTVEQTLAKSSIVNYFHLTRNRSRFLPPPLEGR